MFPKFQHYSQRRSFRQEDLWYPSSTRQFVTPDSMASIEKETSLDEQHCVLCCDDMDFSACGSCDHPICLKCCLKLRMLRKENDCPVCRAQLKEVIVSKDYKSWVEKSLKHQPRQHFRNFGIYHESSESQAKVDELLQHKCPECREIFKSFPLLKDHVRKIHNSFYCDICLRHLRIFTHERHCYTREALVRHRKTGDVDDKSHRGHPPCKFCDERYLDNDELLVHLRKHHFWCHLCEKDGCQDYFPQYKELRMHFQKSHFLCEEDECIHEKFTSVFRSKIDYQVHKAQKHSDKLSKAEARQARQVEIDIRYAPRQTDHPVVVSNRDYSFPEQRNGRRPGNRERATGEASGSRGQDSCVHEGNDDGRAVRNKGKDKDTGRSTKDLRQKICDTRDRAKATQDMEQDKVKNRNSGRITRGPKQEKVSNTFMDSGRTSRNDKVNRDREQTSGDREQTSGDREQTSGDAINGMKSMGISQEKKKAKNVISASKDDTVIQDVSQKSHNSNNSPVVRGGNETATVGKMADKSEPVPEQVQNASIESDTNRLVDSSLKTKADTPAYNDNFPVLTPTAKVDSNATQQYPTKKKAAISSTAKVPPPKRSYDKEFPSLSTISNGQGQTKYTIKGPPGLSAPGQPPYQPTGQKWSAPPPGFAPTKEGATAVVNTKNSGDLKLIDKITRMLSHRGQTFAQFREVSGQFCRGNTSAENYYHECCGLLGEENVQKVFKGLIDLLPDEKKKRELLMVYNDAMVQSKQAKPEPSMSFATSSPVLQHGDFPPLPTGGSSGKIPMKSQQKAAGAWVSGR